MRKLLILLLAVLAISAVAAFVGFKNMTSESKPVRDEDLATEEEAVIQQETEAGDKDAVGQAIKELATFQLYFEATKAVVLEKEKDYIAVVEKPDAVVDKPKTIAAAATYIEQVNQEMKEEIKRLDAIVLPTNEICAEPEDELMQQQCAELHDHLQLYESEVSTFEGMMEIMQQRKIAAESTIKGAATAPVSIPTELEKPAS